MGDSQAIRIKGRIRQRAMVGVAKSDCLPPERDSHTYIPGEVNMVQPVQRPRGPKGHSSCYEHLPWPSDVTQQQIDSWFVEFRQSLLRERAKPNSPSVEKFWVLMPDRNERFGVKADRMEMGPGGQSILLWHQGDLVAVMPATHLCVKDGDITVAGLV